MDEYTFNNENLENLKTSLFVAHKTAASAIESARKNDDLMTVGLIASSMSSIKSALDVIDKIEEGDLEPDDVPFGMTSWTGPAE